MPLSNAQRLIADSPFRFRVAICGRRFGKTHLAIRELAKYARHPGQRVWYVAPTYRQAKQRVYRLVLLPSVPIAAPRLPSRVHQTPQ